MRFQLRPLSGVGPIDFGMQRSSVRQQLGVSYREFFKTPDAKVPFDDYSSLDLHVYYDEELACCGRELWPGADFDVSEHPVLRRPFAEVIGWLTSLDPTVEVRDSLVLSRALGLSLYVPDLDEGEDAPIESAYAFVAWTGT